MTVLGFESFLLAAAQVTLVLVLPPPRATLPAALRLEWLDRAGKVVLEEERKLESGRLPLDPPAGAESFQIVGGGFSSRALTPVAATKRGGIPLQPTGLVRISGLPAVDGITLFFTSTGTGRDEARVVREKRATLEREGVERRLVVEQPAGHYAFGCDAGLGFAPAIFMEIEVLPGHTVDLATPDLSGGNISLLVRDRDTKKPLRGARLLVAEDAMPADRLLMTLLSRRAGDSGSDGLLRLGALAPKQVVLAVGAEKRRSVTLKLSAGFEPGTREIVVAPFQRLEAIVTGLDLKREGKGLALVAGTCRIREKWMPCAPADVRRQTLDEEGRAVFFDMSPGFARVSLEQNGRSTASEMVAISARSEDPDAATLELFLRPLRIRGMTKRRSGEPVEARVLAHSTGNDSATLAETQSGPDGSFDISFYLPWAQSFGLRAESESPSGAGHWYPRLPVSPLFVGADDVAIVLNVGEFHLALKDRKTGAGIPRCRVAGRFQNVEDKSGTYRSLESDDEGIVKFPELALGKVHFVPMCKGYSRTEGVSFDVDPDVEREETMMLDRTGDLTALVLDSRGAPLAGARLFGLDVVNARQTLADVFLSPIALGDTDVDGRLAVDADRWAAVPFYVVAAGHAIYVGRFPAAASCGEQADCGITVEMTRPNESPGLVIHLPEGVNAFGEEVGFTKQGIVIPRVVVYSATVANGLTASDLWMRQGSDLFVTTPRLFGEGEYEVFFQRNDAREPLVGLGRIRVPSSLPAEMTLPATPKTANLRLSAAPS